MLLVILGAGASYDSYGQASPSSSESHLGLADSIDYLADARPPLANELFENRASFLAAMESYPEVTPLAGDLAASGNIESRLDELKASRGNEPQFQRQLMALRFYLKRVLSEIEGKWMSKTGGADNLHVLVDRLRAWQFNAEEPIRFVTFNYDTLLERACRDAIYDLGGRSGMEWYVARDDVRIYKPHGSIDWSQSVKQTVSTYEQAIRKATGLTTAGGFYIDSSIIKARNDPAALMSGIPAISLPFLGKAEFSMPQSHLEALREDMALATRVLVIGWSATEANFLTLWREVREKHALSFGRATSRALTVCGTGRGQITLTNIRDCVDFSHDADVGFSEFIQQPSMLQGFLS